MYKCSYIDLICWKAIALASSIFFNLFTPAAHIYVASQHVSLHAVRPRIYAALLIPLAVLRACSLCARSTVAKTGKLPIHTSDQELYAHVTAVTAVTWPKSPPPSPNVLEPLKGWEVTVRKGLISIHLMSSSWWRWGGVVDFQCKEIHVLVTLIKWLHRGLFSNQR